MFGDGAILLVLLVLVLEAAVTSLVIRDLVLSYGATQRIYLGSVRGLRRIGELQYETQETRRSTLYALTTSDANLQVSYADQAHEADGRVTQGISEYLTQARTPQETGIGQRLAKDWGAYLQVRDDVLSRILEGSLKEAIDVDLMSGVPLFDRVRQDLEEIKRLYDEQASQQLAEIGESSRHSLARLIPTLVFSILFGTVGIFAILRNQIRTATESAKLQMDFVASVSHELRTPLTAIIAIGENIRDGIVQGHDVVHEQVAIMTGQANRLMDLVDQVLLFAATTKSRPWHPVQEVQVSEIVEHALRSTQELVQEAGFIIERQMDPGLPPVVGDLLVFSQCLQNLIINAVKYSKSARWVEVSIKADDAPREVRISVQDRGIGINSADLAHVFEPFYRSAQAVASPVRGTGLGLSIAKRGVEIFGGRLTVLSGVGIGSTFTMHLPVSDRRRKLGVSGEARLKVGAQA